MSSTTTFKHTLQNNLSPVDEVALKAWANVLSYFVAMKQFRGTFQKKKKKTVQGDDFI